MVTVCSMFVAVMGAMKRPVVGATVRVKPLALMRAYFVASERLAFSHPVFVYLFDDEASSSDTQQGSAKVGSSLNLCGCAGAHRCNDQCCNHNLFHKPIHLLFLSDQLSSTGCAALC